MQSNQANKLSEKETILIYCGLLNALIDHIEGDFRPSFFNKQNVKFLSNNLLKELMKIEGKIYEGKEEISAEVTDQLVSAGTLMLEFFKLGIEMSELELDQQELLNCDINILLSRYNITKAKF